MRCVLDECRCAHDPQSRCGRAGHAGSCLAGQRVDSLGFLFLTPGASSPPRVHVPSLSKLHSVARNQRGSRGVSGGPSFGLRRFPGPAMGPLHPLPSLELGAHRNPVGGGGRSRARFRGSRPRDHVRRDRPGPTQRGNRADPNWRGGACGAGGVALRGPAPPSLAQAAAAWLGKRFRRGCPLPWLGYYRGGGAGA